MLLMVIFSRWSREGNLWAKVLSLSTLHIHFLTLISTNGLCNHCLPNKMIYIQRNKG